MRTPYESVNVSTKSVSQDLSHEIHRYRDAIGVRAKYFRWRTNFIYKYMKSLLFFILSFTLYLSLHFCLFVCSH